MSPRPAERCPVCIGRGWVEASFYSGLPILGRETCRTCRGAGALQFEPVVAEKLARDEAELRALRVLVHGHCQVIRGMCTDELDHREIDRALVRLDDAVNPPEDERP